MGAKTECGRKKWIYKGGTEKREGNIYVHKSKGNRKTAKRTTSGNVRSRWSKIIPMPEYHVMKTYGEWSY
jgi:hypothetical protein